MSAVRAAVGLVVRWLYGQHATGRSATRVLACASTTLPVGVITMQQASMCYPRETVFTCGLGQVVQAGEQQQCRRNQQVHRRDPGALRLRLLLWRLQPQQMTASPLTPSTCVERTESTACPSVAAAATANDGIIHDTPCVESAACAGQVSPDVDIEGSGQSLTAITCRDASSAAAFSAAASAAALMRASWSTDTVCVTTATSTCRQVRKHWLLGP